MVMISLTMTAMIFGLFGPIYYLDGDSTISTRVDYDLWSVCVENQGEKKCIHLYSSDTVLHGIGDAKILFWNQVAALVSLFLALGFSLIIVILGFFACCNVINLAKCAAIMALAVLATLVFFFALTACAVPTSEYETESKLFNNKPKRMRSFYGRFLTKFASQEVLSFDASRSITSDLQSPQFEVKFGWVLGVMWVAPCLAFMAMIFFGCAKCCLAKAENKKQQQLQKQQKEDKNQSTSLMPDKKSGSQAKNQSQQPQSASGNNEKNYSSMDETSRQSR